MVSKEYLRPFNKGFDHPPGPLPFDRLRAGSGQEGGRDLSLGDTPSPPSEGKIPSGLPCYDALLNSREYFDRVASQWDEMRHGLFSEAVRDKAIALAGVREGSDAADVGAGTGFVTEGLIRLGARVIAVDQSEAMLAEMKKKFTGVGSIEHRLGEAESLPLDSGSVDYAFANMYLHHVGSPPKAIQEMARVLRPGGRLIVTDMDEHRHEFLRREHHDRWLGFRREDVRRWFAEAGLRNVVVDDVGET